MKRKRNQKGFTLIELMIVIAIIAILMAYGLSAYTDYTIRTFLNEGQTMASSVKQAVNVGFVENSDLTNLNSGSNGIPQAAQPGACVSTLTTVSGVITAAFDCAAGSRGQAHPDVDGQTVTMTPTPTASGGLQWACTSSYDATNPARSPC